MSRYPSDLTNSQWKIIAPLIPTAKSGGRPRSTSMRDVVDALLYMSRTGCQWRFLPKEYPPRSTVYDYFKAWKENKVWDKIVNYLRENVRIKEGRSAEPSAGIIDSQSVKSVQESSFRSGYDGGKKIKGTKRHIIVDILGLLICVIVHSAQIQDRSAALSVIKKALNICPPIKIFWADGGYTGSLIERIKSKFNRVLEIIKRPRGEFKIVAWRWVVERTFGWLNRHRRLSKDYERTKMSSESWVKIASIELMINRLEPK